MAYPDPPTTPPVPQRGDRATFSGRVDAFLTWVAAIIPWLQGYIADFLATLTTLAAGGANSFSYRFDTSTAVGDPGPGSLRLNSSPQNGASRLIIDPMDRNGVDISAVLNSITASTSSLKGSVRLQKVNDPTAWMLFDITGFTAATGFYNLTLALRASSSPSPFAANDSVIVFTERNGDRGDNAGANFAKFSDLKVSGTGGGQGVANTTQDRTLNTTDFNNISGASLSGSSIILPAGTYEINARVPGYRVNSHRAYLFNETDNTTVLRGSNSASGTPSGPYSQTDSNISGIFSLTSPKTFKIQHFILTSQGFGTTDLGIPVTIAGQMEVYTEVVLRKIA